MDNILEFLMSDIGVAVAWFCTVGSAFYSVLKVRENKSLKLKIQNYKSTISTDKSQDTVTQNGEKSIYTKNNSGGMNINM